MTALAGGIPDRVPHIEIDILPHVINQIMPGASVLDFFEEFDIDGICVFYDLLYQDVAKDIKKDCFGIHRNFKEMHGEFPFPVEPLVPRDMDPLKFLDTYEMPKPCPENLQTLQATLDRLKGKKAVGFIMHTNLIYPSFFRGFDELMLDYYINPEFALRLGDMFADFFIELEEMAFDMGADFVLDGEDYAGTKSLWMSGEMLERFCLPGLRRAIDTAHKKGAPFVKHCDGAIMPILDLLVEQKIDCLNPIEPAAGMDLGVVKKLIGDKVSLWGNVDCAHLLTFGTPEQVREATIQCIKDAAPNGGYILSSSNTIHEAVPPENFLMMNKTVREFGKYPLEL
jgi:uroporphyrinogen decarboxylase